MAAATETLELLRAYADAGDLGARDKLVANYSPLVRKLCNRFRSSREPREDLFQVGVIGLLNAIEKFDLRQGTKFSSLAIPEVLGAILNYLMDHGSTVKVPRVLRQKRLKVDRSLETLPVELERWPTTAEVGEACDMDDAEVNAAMKLAHEVQPRSLDEQMNSEESEDGFTLADFIGRVDEGFDNTLDRIIVKAALESLPTRERRVMRLRFYKGMSQTQTARAIEVSQMHVSRLERRALMRLRPYVQVEASPRPRSA